MEHNAVMALATSVGGDIRQVRECVGRVPGDLRRVFSAAVCLPPLSHVVW